MGLYLISIWLLVGAVAHILTRRTSRGNRPSRRDDAIPVGLFIVGVASGVVSVASPDPWSSAFVWITLGSVNLSFASAAWDRSPRVLPTLGSAATVVALALIALRSFTGLPVIVAAGVLCLAAALFGRPVDKGSSPSVARH
ncbi:MAG: hypothetical protein KGK07_14120 [Chloroflexota bacterium]|nr:hypothetical protein [Chloroflexota bacterium]